jgi:hypothetical protein
MFWPDAGTGSVDPADGRSGFAHAQGSLPECQAVFERRREAAVVETTPERRWLDAGTETAKLPSLRGESPPRVCGHPYPWGRIRESTQE